MAFDRQAQFIVTGARYANLDWLFVTLNSLEGVTCLKAYKDSDLGVDCELTNNTFDAFFDKNGSLSPVTGALTNLSLLDCHSKALFEKTSINFSRENVVSDPARMVQEFVDRVEAEFKGREAAGIKWLRTGSRGNPFFYEIFNSRPLFSVDKEKLRNVAFVKGLSYLAEIHNDQIVPAKNFNVERLVAEPQYLNEFVFNLTRGKNTSATLKGSVPTFSVIDLNSWPPWARTVFQEKLRSLNLIRFYSDLGFKLEYVRGRKDESTQRAQINPLVSIQLNSNRPGQFSWFLDSIEETVDSPSSCEVLIHIDEGDEKMERAVLDEIKRRPFTIKYIKTNIVKSFADLWKPLNELIKITDPKAYFLLNLADEMLFLTKGWDTKLRQYVGYYSDDIFRLRASRFRFRNYNDLWECGYAPDSLTFYTKRWLDIGGDWNPCLGPDSFQQCVAFHMSKLDPFASNQLNRDVPLPDIKFSGEGASIGLSADAHLERNQIHFDAWFVLMGHSIQQEAVRRATLLKANVVADAFGIDGLLITDEAKSRKIVISDPSTGSKLEAFSYAQSPLKYWIRNSWRRLGYYYYCGGGRAAHPSRRALRLAYRVYLKIPLVHRSINALRLGPRHIVSAFAWRINRLIQARN